MNTRELQDLERQRQELQRRLNDHHESADRLRTLIGELAQRIAFLTDIINRARTKFCEDGSDGAIAAEMFRILGEASKQNDQDLVRWEVQRHDMLRGWNTWVIYDEQRHAETECARRISESPERDKGIWRVAKRTNDQS